MVKIVRLILYIIFITYFVGQYWFIIVEVAYLGYQQNVSEEFSIEKFGEDE